MKPKKSTSISSQWVDQELIVLHEGNGQVHKLNPTAAEIFELCDGETDRHAIVDKLVELFDAAPAAVAADVDRVLASFHDLGLLDTK